MEAQRDRVTSELKRAIMNINRNLYDWKGKKAGKTNFSISYNEVYSITKGWITRCLRSIIDTNVIDRVFRAGNLHLQVDDTDMYIKNLQLQDISLYRFYSDQATGLSNILKSIDFEKLKYNPDDFMLDGVTQRTDEFYYPKYEPSFSALSLVSYDSLTPKT